jgi:hypothetical protein
MCSKFKFDFQTHEFLAAEFSGISHVVFIDFRVCLNHVSSLMKFTSVYARGNLSDGTADLRTLCTNEGHANNLYAALQQ